MERISLSPDGPVVSRMAWGAWRLADDPVTSQSSATGRQAVRRLLDTCLDHGITTIDHADIYGGHRCEAICGEVLRAAPGLRDRLEIVTKCGIRLVGDAQPDVRVKHYDTTAGHISASVENSLRNLSTDVIDVLLLHRPDPLQDPDETAEALRRLRESGKIRYAGVSNYTPSQFELLQSRLDFPLVTNQIEVSPLHITPFTNGVLDHSLGRQIRPMAWSPLAGGRLMTGGDDATERVRHAIRAVSARHSAAGVDQTALAWLLRHPSGMVPVIGTGKPDRIVAAAGALAIDLDRQSWFEIYEASLGGEVP